MESETENPEENLRAKAWKWVGIILFTQFVVFLLPLLVAVLLSTVAGYRFEAFDTSKVLWGVPAAIPTLLLFAAMFGWGYDVFAFLAWRRFIHARLEIARVERGVRGSLFALSTPYVLGNAFITPFYFLDARLKGHEALGLSFWSFWIIPLVGLLFARLAKPPEPKGAKQAARMGLPRGLFIFWAIASVLWLVYWILSSVAACVWQTIFCTGSTQWLPLIGVTVGLPIAGYFVALGAVWVLKGVASAIRGSRPPAKSEPTTTNDP
jgi:hypothetical protein